MLIVTDAITNDTLSGVTKTTPATFSVPTGDDQDCIDDIIDVLTVASWNLAMGGNDFTYDAAQLYISGNHVQGEENHSIYAFRQARDIAIECFQNEVVTTGGHTTRTQFRDLTITQDTGLPICANVIASLTTLMNIVEVAVDTGSLSGVTRTASYASVVQTLLLLSPLSLVLLLVLLGLLEPQVILMVSFVHILMLISSVLMT